MADTYKFFTSDDLIVGETSIISNPVWTGDLGTLAISNALMPTQTVAHQYHVPVYNVAPATAGAAVQFSVAYGDFDGFGSVGDTSIVDGTSNRPTKVIYQQYANLLLDAGQAKFRWNNADQNSFMAISVNRARMKQKLDPGNWMIVAGGVGYKDNSGAGENPNINAGGRVFSVYPCNASTGIITSTTPIGLFYPDFGIILLQSGITGVPVKATSATATYLNRTFVGNMTSFQARSEEKVTSNYYFCRVTNKQFNFSTNKTYISGSGYLRWPGMVNDPQSYITTVGLYNNANELLAVAKLSKPLLKNFQREALIKIKIDY